MWAAITWRKASMTAGDGGLNASILLLRQLEHDIPPTPPPGCINGSARVGECGTRDLQD
jgi:hypothetical protein